MRPCGNPSKTDGFRRFLGDLLEIYGKCPPTENLQTRKSEQIPALYSVEATFAITYLCLLFRAGLKFSIKYIFTYVRKMGEIYIYEYLSTDVRRM